MTDNLENNLNNVIRGWEHALNHPSNIAPDNEWKKGNEGMWSSANCDASALQLVRKYGPVTTIHEPKVN